jgi:tetratricopeptide (TPR) repeat protein
MQTSHEWYRRTAWTPADERDFFVRLGRARKKTEYLLQQAQVLLKTVVHEHTSAALRLLDLLLAEYPDAFYLSNAHLARAEALVMLDRLPEAIDAFRSALEARRELPNVINYAYLEFGWTVARLRRHEHYDEVLAALREFDSAADLTFPVNAYRYFGALAMIADDHQSPGEAHRWAARAIEAASVEKGPFSRHPEFGTLDLAEVDVEAHRRLCQLAAV